MTDLSTTIPESTPVETVAEKTYKRETAWAFAIFTAQFYMWGVYGQDQTAIDVAKYLTPFATGALTAALWADWASKQQYYTTPAITGQY